MEVEFFVIFFPSALAPSSHCEFCVNSSNLNLALRVLDAEQQDEFCRCEAPSLVNSLIFAPMGIPQIFRFIIASGMRKGSASDVQRGRCHFQHDSMRKREAQMKLTVKAAAVAFLAAGLVVSYAQTSGATPPAKKHVAKKPAVPAGPTVQQQIDDMKQQFQGEIDGLKADLATKDEQLQKAQQTAADAQAAAAKAEADATAQQQAATDNAAAVTTLQSSVSDLKMNAVSLA